MVEATFGQCPKEGRFFWMASLMLVCNAGGWERCTRHRGQGLRAVQPKLSDEGGIAGRGENLYL